jgi:exodeoxyribonuclease VII small subunit
MAERTKKRKFDEGLAELQKIGSELERGDLALEDALAAYERGVALVRELNQQLTETEARVQLLTRNPEGELSLQPMDRGDNAES